MTGQSAMDCLKESVALLTESLSAVGLEKQLLNVVDRPDDYPAAFALPDARHQIGYLQGFADGMNMTVREMLDEFEIHLEEE